MKLWINLYYTEEFAMLHRIIHYSVNKVTYNEGLIGQNAGFVVSRGDCNSKRHEIECMEKGKEL